MVRLPLKISALHLLGTTDAAAESQMKRLVRRFSANPELRHEYKAFMSDYEQGGHMRRVSPPKDKNSTFYLPHHGIWQRADDRQKLRVVFNASFQSSTGLSLNDVMHTGPPLQRDLSAIISRWRFHKIVFCTDIGQMYRQIMIDPRDTDWQRIVWQSEEDGPIRHYQLLTVTYGMSCAPYLAIRTLKRLVEDEGSAFPLAKEVLLSDTYVDDIVSGAEDLPSALLLQDQRRKLLRSGRFPLRKWVSNHPRMLEGLSEEERLRPKWKDFTSDGPVHALGISWDPAQDEMRFTVPPISFLGGITKRKVLSTIAQLFDPLGWLSPYLIRAKILMQELWKRKILWDETLPPDLMKCWTCFCEDLRNIATIRIPRWLDVQADYSLQIHGFADASQQAYAAVLYLRLRSPSGQINTKLLTSKTRIAPVKILTIPRLELCAAVLLIRLIRKTIQDMDRTVESVYA